MQNIEAIIANHLRRLRGKRRSDSKICSLLEPNLITFTKSKTFDELKVVFNGVNVTDVINQSTEMEKSISMGVKIEKNIGLVSQEIVISADDFI